MPSTASRQKSSLRRRCLQNAQNACFTGQSRLRSITLSITVMLPIFCDFFVPKAVMHWQLERVLFSILHDV
jgi:hypothetical protein